MSAVLRPRATNGPCLALAALLAAGCVQVEPEPDFERARALVERSTGRDEVYDPYAPPLGEAELEALLADGLSLDEALRLALINSRELQAEFQDIGIAHADWVQSRLLSNPSLDVLLLFPSGGGRTSFESFVGVDLFELWRIPVRKEAARRNLEATVLRIARTAGTRLADARNAYYAAVAAEELERVAAQNVELVAASARAVEDLHEAGVADALDESLARGPLLGARLALRTARIGAANARRELARALSLAGPVHDLALTDALPRASSFGEPAEALVQRALEARLDLAAMRVAIGALEQRVLEERRKAWGDLEAGPAFQQQPVSGPDLVGPGLSLTPPLFDQNQAGVARAEFELVQLTKRYEAACIAVAQDVRTGADRLRNAAEGLEFYAAELLPQSERALALAQESHAAGRATLLAVVEVQRQLLEARRAHVALRLEAALAATDLERAVGMPRAALER